MANVIERFRAFGCRIFVQIFMLTHAVQSSGLHCRMGLASDPQLLAINRLAELPAERPMICSQMCIIDEKCRALTYFKENSTCVLVDTLDFVHWHGAKMCTKLPNDPGTIALHPAHGGGKVHIFGGNTNTAVAHQMYEPDADDGAGAASVVPHDPEELPILYQHYAATIGCCKVYLIGGYRRVTATAAVEPNYDVFVFNLADGTWGKDVPMTTNRRLFYGVTYNDRIYVCAGLTDGAYNRTCFVYVPGQGVLHEDYVRYHGGGTGRNRLTGNSGQVDGTFYYAGGHNAKQYGSAVAELLATDEHMLVWRTLSPLPTFIRAGFAAALAGEFYYCPGNRYRHAGLINALQRWCRRYNAVADQWLVVATHPANRYAGATATLNGRLYLLSGRRAVNVAGNYHQTAVERYDPQTDTWSILATRIAAGSHWSDAVGVEN